MKINAGSLCGYLTATLENAQDHLAEPPQLMFMVHNMDQIFHQEIFDQDFEANPISALLVANSYALLLSAVRQALSGHVVSTFPIPRTALESACYAFLIARDQAKGEIWLNRHTSGGALQRCRKTFTVQKAVNELKVVSLEMSEYVMGLYDASIDFGAHPNRNSVFNHLEDSGPLDGGLHGFDLAGVYGQNSWQVNHAILACVEVGQAIAFLVAASAVHHPLIHERLNVFQDWMDVKRKIVEEVSGVPLDYIGPIYCSVIPPA